MQFRRTEIRVRRIVLIQPPNARVTKQDTSTSIRLQTVFVRINHDGVGLSYLVESQSCVSLEILRQSEISSVSRVRVNPEPVFRAQLQCRRQWIHGTRCRRSHCDNNCSHIPMLQACRQRITVHAPELVGSYRFERQLQHAADSAVRVMRLFARQNFLPRMELPRNP